MSTIIDVAKTVGAWTATGSRALRGLDRVNHETREREERIAAKLNFVPSPTAASLACGRTRVIGVVAPFLTRWEETLDRGEAVSGQVRLPARPPHAPPSAEPPGRGRAWGPAVPGR